MKQLLLSMVLLLLALPFASAYLQMDTVYTDPAIIAAGDEVDVIVQYSNIVTGAEEFYANDYAYSFRVQLLADDDVTKNYVRILDSTGDDVGSKVYPGQQYSKVFRIKILESAPTGTYEFRLVGDWYKDGVAVGVSRDETFTVSVKRDAIDIALTHPQTNPRTIRAGDTAVELLSFVENSGLKGAENLEVQLQETEYFSPSYGDGNALWVGVVGPGESKDVQFFIDIEKATPSGAYAIPYTVTYEDADQKTYSYQNTLKLYVKEKAYLEVAQEDLVVAKGGSAYLDVTVTNTGDARAEYVDVRVLKQSSQPFTFHERSQYIGLLEPGESTTVRFAVDVSRKAQEQEYAFDVLLRAKGDSEHGDDDVYTFSRSAKLAVSGEAKNNLVLIGLIAAAVIVLVIIWRLRKK